MLRSEENRSGQFSSITAARLAQDKGQKFYCGHVALVEHSVLIS